MTRKMPILALGCVLFGVGAATQVDRGRTSDRATITRLENEWLHAQDAATLERILAPDFVHVIPLDHFLTKQEHIAWFGKHLQPENRRTKFDKFSVRFYGNTAIVNGSVIATDDTGRELDRTMFTDVFVFRNGRWQAVNGQENDVRREPR